MKKVGDAIFTGADSIPFFKQAELTVPAGSNITDYNAINIVSGDTLTTTSLKNLIEGANFGTISTERDLLANPLPEMMTGIGDDTIPNLYNIFLNQLAKIPISIMTEYFFEDDSSLGFEYDIEVVGDVNVEINLHGVVEVRGARVKSPKSNDTAHYLVIKPQWTLSVTQQNGAIVLVSTDLVDTTKTTVQLRGSATPSETDTCNMYTSVFTGTASVDPESIPLTVDAHFTGGHAGDVFVASSWEVPERMDPKFNEMLYEIMYYMNTQYDVSRGMRYLLSNYGFTSDSKKENKE